MRSALWPRTDLDLVLHRIAGDKETEGFEEQ